MKNKKTYSVKVKKMFEPYKFWEEAKKKEMKPLIDFCQSQHDRIKELEDRVRQLEQPSILEPPVDKYEGRSSTLKEQEKVEYRVEAHAYSLVSGGKIEGIAAKKFMERRGLSKEDVKTMAYAYEKKLKKNADSP